MTESEKKYEASPCSGALCQGEIVANLKQLQLAPASLSTESVPIVETLEHPFAIVLTQDCDLQQQYSNMPGNDDGPLQLPNILFCEAVPAKILRQKLPPGSKLWKKVRQNKDERYHCLEAVPQDEDAHGDGISSLGVDFKRLFTIPTREVYGRIETSDTKRRARLLWPYAHHLVMRLYYFQYRVGLPQDHVIEI